MSESRIDPATRIGAVHLNVSDLERARTFYLERLGLHERHREAATSWLGAPDADLLVLHHEPSARRVARTTGLYHFALLVPSRFDLSGALARLHRTSTPMQGAADHGVSEALYLADPEGNGIEIYRDREPMSWPRANGGLAMVSDPLDLDALLAEAGGDASRSLPNGTRIGHVHLHAGEIPRPERFYCDVLGFDLTQRFAGSAAFVSAGGYHHHVGMNTWLGIGAPPPPRGSAGLRHYELMLPDAAALVPVRERLATAGVPLESAGEGFGFWDLDGHRIELRPESGAA